MCLVGLQFLSYFFSVVMTGFDGGEGLGGGCFTDHSSCYRYLSKWFEKLPREALLYADYIGTIMPLVALYSNVTTDPRSEWVISLWSCQNCMSAAW